MAVSLLNKNYNTQICRFSFDVWDEDKDKLPTLNTKGKDSLSDILSCKQGSVAVGTDGTSYILTGNNEWVKYSNAMSGGNNDEDDDGFDPDTQTITTEDIYALFK